MERSYNDFSDNPLAPLFYQFIDILKSRCFLKEAEDLEKIAERHYLPENRNIITRIAIEMQKAAVSNEVNKFEQLLKHFC
ncbi:hypothetical protein MPCS_01580 (plasmid) [Candidatus Megaera polyxenophila]|jgi:hypothetical protein|nr:hypothetical protein MPCS_01580 [Candidatus Megaera polyxenophila]